MNGRTRVVSRRAERPQIAGLPMASVQMAFLVSSTMLLTVLWASLSRADVWVTVNPGGSVTRTEVVAPQTTAPGVPGQVSVSTNTTTTGATARGFVPRQGPGIALEKQTMGIALDPQRYGVALQPQTPYAGTNIYSGTQTYNGLYPPVITTTPAPVGYPYYPQPYYPQGYCPQPYYPQPYYGYGQPNCAQPYPGYYPAPGYYGYQPGPYSFPIGNPNRPSGWITHLGSSAPIFYPPVIVGGYGSVYSSTVVSPSAGVTFGNRGVQVSINSGRTTTSTTVVTPSR